jgi:asparagine N-glycosylation enzyme membrane subunit Stt3
MSRSRRVWLPIGLHVLVLLVATGLRFSSFSTARADGDWLLADGDSYYHLRRIGLTIEQGGQVPMFDPYLAFPDGQKIQWHGGYDLLVAGIVASLCGNNSDHDCLTNVAVLSTPFLGVLATLCVLLLGRAVGGPWHGLLAGTLFAVYPFSAGSAAVGHVDHHVMEPLMVALWFLALCKERAVLAGLLAGLSFSIFPTALFPVGATVGALMIERVVQFHKNGPPNFVGVTFAWICFAVLVPVVWTGGFADSWEPAATSLFHLAVMGVAAVALTCAEVVGRFARQWRATLAGSAAFSVVVLCVAIGWSHVSALFRFAKVQGLWSGVVQQVPLGTGVFAQILLVVFLLVVCTASFVLARKREAPGMRIAALAALPLGLAGLFQIRFLMMASALVVVVIAHVFLAIVRGLKERLANESRRTQWLGHAVMFGLAVLILLPVGEYFMPRAKSQPLLSGTRILKRLGKKQHRLPLPSVLSDWIWGHHILYFARLPTVASPFILSGLDQANVEARRALLAEDPNTLYRIMDKHQSQYLLITGMFNPEAAARSLGLAPKEHPIAKDLMAKTLRDWSRLRLVDMEGDARLYELVPGKGIER